MSLIKTSLLLAALLFLGCASGKPRQEDNWEGIAGDKLQVCVVNEYTDDERLLLLLKQRAVIVIINYINTKYPPLRDSSAIEPVLIDCFEKPTVLLKDCGEADCIVLAVFDIKAALDILRAMFPEQ
ncbi:MAG: hypothetical protein LBT84_08100 [Spirochaetia bacterium]|jgi:hypothetical protein|nr:hypothetical protein [Spirochaetia bacterium]